VENNVEIGNSSLKEDKTGGRKNKGKKKQKTRTGRKE
jgi:hypothetical protein